MSVSRFLAFNIANQPRRRYALSAGARANLWGQASKTKVMVNRSFTEAWAHHESTTAAKHCKRHAWQLNTCPVRNFRVIPSISRLREQRPIFRRGSSEKRKCPALSRDWRAGVASNLAYVPNDVNVSPPLGRHAPRYHREDSCARRAMVRSRFGATVP